MRILNDLLKPDKLLHLFITGWVFYILMSIFKDYEIACFSTILLFIGKEIYKEFIIEEGHDVINLVSCLIGFIISLVIWDVFNF